MLTSVLPYFASLARHDDQGLSLPKRALPRLLFYGSHVLAASTAFLLMGVGPVIGNSPGRSPFFYAVVTGAGIFAVVVGVFVVVLIGFASSDPDEETPLLLSRCYFHVIPFAFISFSWLALGIFFVVETVYECEHGSARCKLTAFYTSLAFMLSIFSSISAAFVTHAVYSSHLPWSTHIEKARFEGEFRRNGKEISTSPVMAPQLTAHWALKTIP